MSDPMVNMEPVSRKKNQTSFVDPLDMDNMPLATFDRYSSMPPEKTKSASDTKIKLNIRDFSNAAERENPYPPQQEKYYDTPSLSNSQSVNFQYNNYDNQKYNPNNNQMFEPKSKAVANIFGKPPAQLDHFMPNEPKLPSLQKSNSSNSSTIKIYNTDMMNKQGPRPPNTLPQQQQPSMSQSYNPPDSYNSYNTQNTFSTGNTQNNFSTTHNDPYAQSQPQRSMQQHQSLNQTPQQNPSLQRNISAPAFPQQKMTSNPVPQNQHQMNYNKPPTMYPQSYGPSIQPEKIQQPSYTQNNYPQPTMSFHDDAGFGNFHESPPNYSSNSNYIQPHQSYIKQDIQPQPQHQHQHQPQQQSQPQLQTQSQPQSQPYQSQVYPPQNNYNHNSNSNNYNTSSNYNSSFTLPIQDYDKPEHQFHDKFMDLKTDPVMKSPEKVFSPPQEMMKEEEPLNFILEKKPNEKPVIKVEKPKPQFSTPPPVKNDIPKTPDVVFERPSKDLGKSPNPFKISINKTVFDETSKPTHNPIVETKTKEPSQVFEKPNVIKIKNPSSVESSKDTQIKISFGSSKTPVIVPPTITPTISISEPTPVTISTPKFYPEPEKEPPPTIKPLPQAEDKDLKITVIQKEKVPEELPKPQIITAQKSTENENISNLEIPSLMPTNSEISVPDLEQTVSVTSDMMLDDPFEPYDSKIKFNVQEMQEKFKQNLVTKVPKYIFKFKKCVRNLDSAFLRWDIREEKIIAMRNDIFNSLFGEKPFVYSRALLFLFITTTYIKYAFEVQKLEKKGFKEIFKITQKAYNYLKSIIDISYISFSPQDTDGFDRERRDFRSKHKEQKKERIIPMMPPEDDTLAIFDSDPGKKFKSTKESTKIQLNSKLLGQGKKLFKPEKDETKEDVIRRQVQELIRRVRDFNEEYPFPFLFNP